ncbi:MAG: hypothetical protein IJ087_00930 [Eggerthellaceae bacterium]|nr:hypothetical protein [Eggerthellaceae bacterium]
MDFTPYIGPIATVAIGLIGFYIAMKNANNAKFEALSVQLAAQNAEQTAEIRALKQQLADLKAEVEKHNGVIERTYKLESDMHTAFKRIDELKDADLRIERRIER